MKLRSATSVLLLKHSLRDVYNFLERKELSIVMGNQYHLVQNPLPFSLLSRNTKITIYRTISLPVLLCGCETWSLTLREEQGNTRVEKIT